MSQARAFFNLIRWSRPIGALLLLWPTYWGLWLANTGMPPTNLLILFALGVFLTRSAGCVINDIADRKVDGHVTRTANRPLATGVLTTQQAIGLFVVLMLAAFMVALALNIKVIILAVIAAGLIVLYPFTKRWIAYPQVILGSAWGMSVLMAYAASNTPFTRYTGLLYVAVVAWVVAFDTYYALEDKPDDVQVGILSTARQWGARLPRYCLACHGLTFALLLVVGQHYGLGLWTHGCWCVAGLLVCCQAWRTHQALKCDEVTAGKVARSAFLDNNRVGALIWLGIAGHYLH